jgi:FlaA1/EpsC-like NDP-sugar epimerase
VAYFIIFVSILTLIWRLIYVRIFSAATKSAAPGDWRRKAGSTLVNILADQAQPPYNLLGLIDDDPEKLGAEIRGYKILGDHSQLLTLAKELGVTDLILAISGR